MSHPINLMVLDLCHYDNVLDYDEVRAAGIVGVIYKASEGTGYQDSTYVSERKRALKAGLLWGAYHFGDASDVQGQVNNFVQTAQIDEASLFVLDFEDYGGNTMSLESAQAWIIGVEAQLGRPSECVLYSGNLIKEGLDGASKALRQFFGQRRLWLAQYGSSPSWPDCWESFWIWQYSGDGDGPGPHTVEGISGDCDCNSYDGTPEELAAEWASGTPLPDQPMVIITISSPPGVTIKVVPVKS
jgi:GH25 family lysozyme M1 (1,4-beta-N-acetylmuramidase)